MQNLHDGPISTLCAILAAECKFAGADVSRATLTSSLGERMTKITGLLPNLEFYMYEDISFDTFTVRCRHSKNFIGAGVLNDVNIGTSIAREILMDYSVNAVAHPLQDFIADASEVSQLIENRHQPQVSERIANIPVTIQYVSTYFIQQLSKISANIHSATFEQGIFAQGVRTIELSISCDDEAEVKFIDKLARRQLDRYLGVGFFDPLAPYVQASFMKIWHPLTTPLWQRSPSSALSPRYVIEFDRFIVRGLFEKLARQGVSDAICNQLGSIKQQ